MNLPRLTYFLLLFVGLQSVALAQVDSTRIDSVIIDTTLLVPVELPSERPDTTAEEQKPLLKVIPWEFHAPVGAKLAATDSTLRWQIWPDWTYKLNREPGVISYRLGTSLRANVVQRDAHEPRHQQLYWEGVSLNDPVSGAVNWMLIPQHKISEFYEEDLGLQHRSTFYLHQYYLNEPLSRLIYSESKFSFRNLEFEVSHNLSQRTNVELSYWDRRAGGEFPNSEITGRQIFAKVTHHLDNKRFLKINLVNNNFDIGQPFGYNILNLGTFDFDRFTTSANEASSMSQEASNLLMLNFYQRNDTTDAVDDLHAGIFYRNNKRSLTYIADSTRYNVHSVGLNGKKWLTWGGLTLEGTASFEQFFNTADGDEGLDAASWTLFKTEGDISLDFTRIIDLKGGAGLQIRGDGFQSYRLNATSDIKLWGLTLSPGISTGSIMPTPQQLYWRSAEFSGNTELRNEKIQEARGTISINFTPDTRIGVRGQHKDIRDGILIADSTFSNVESYASQSATAFFEWNLEHFEFNGSATVHRFADSYTAPSGTIPMSPRRRIWLKGDAYWKGYLFDRATYVKAGVSGMMAPFRYQADEYSPVLDTWQPISDAQLIPAFNRLDVDISARVRSIVFTLRWENVLDDVNQLGYFEAAQYPMANRRFIFGIRALFRN